MKDIAFQKKYIHELVLTSVGYIQDEDPKLIVFQAPTGSGKTIMLAEAMSRMVKELGGEMPEDLPSPEKSVKSIEKEQAKLEKK